MPPSACDFRSIAPEGQDEIQRLIDNLFLHHGINRPVPAPEYVQAKDRLLLLEYAKLNPKLKATVDAIRREGKIPLFRAVAGDWVDPKDQLPWDTAAVDRMRAELRAQGLGSFEGQARINARFRFKTASTSLSFAGALAVGLVKADLFNSHKVTVAVLAWDGKTGKPGFDPVEILADPMSVEVRERVVIDPQFIKSYQEQGLSHKAFGENWVTLMHRLDGILDSASR